MGLPANPRGAAGGLRDAGRGLDGRHQRGHADRVPRRDVPRPGDAAQRDGPTPGRRRRACHAGGPELLPPGAQRRQRALVQPLPGSAARYSRGSAPPRPATRARRRARPRVPPRPPGARMAPGRSSVGASVSQERADAFVFFGATGDLAHKKIFPALQTLARRGDLGNSRQARLQRIVDRIRCHGSEVRGRRTRSRFFHGWFSGVHERHRP